MENNNQDFESLFDHNQNEFSKSVDRTGFVSAAIDPKTVNETLIALGKNRISFGINFLDECLGGINKNDFVVVSAGSGLGKTQTALSIAMQAALDGKKVYFFALEAARLEIQYRMIYKEFYSLYFRKSESGQIQKSNISLTDFWNGVLSEKYPELIEEAAANLSKYENIFLHYRDEPLGIDGFKKLFLNIKNDAELIVVDHLHYFNLDSDKEAFAIKEICQSMKNLSGNHDTPIILVSHIRKLERNNHRPDVPTLDDLHGSSEIAKTATKVITFARYTLDGKEVNLVAAMKNRNDGSRQLWTAVLNYDSEAQGYNQKYYIGRVEHGKFALWEKDKGEKFPYWAKSAENEGKPNWANPNGLVDSIPTNKLDEKPKATGSKRYLVDNHVRF